MDIQTSFAKGNLYLLLGKIAGWASVAAFTFGFVNKIAVREWLFAPSDLLQAALYLVLFAIFASLVGASQH